MSVSPLYTALRHPQEAAQRVRHPPVPATASSIEPVRTDR